MIMILSLIAFLRSCGLHVPTVFEYNSTRALLAGMLSLSIVLLLGPRCIAFLTKRQIGDYPRVAEEVPLLAGLHEHKRKTPTMGGLLLAFATFFSFICFMDFSQIYVWLFLFVLLCSSLCGFIDDYQKVQKKAASGGISEKSKYLLFGTMSALVALYLLLPFVQNLFPVAAPKGILFLTHLGQQVELSLSELQRVYFFPCCKYPLVLDGYFGFLIAAAFILFILIGSGQATNITDGFDGLAAGAAIPVTLVLGGFAFLSGHALLAKGLNLFFIHGAGEVAVAMAALCGAVVGFLWYNGYPAQIFMGDTGSLMIGSLMGLAAILIRREFVFGVAAFVFVIETLSVIIQRFGYRYFNKKRFFLCAPLHYHYQMQGVPESKIVLRFWILGWFFAMIALATIKFQ